MFSINTLTNDPSFFEEECEIRDIVRIVSQFLIKSINNENLEDEWLNVFNENKDVFSFHHEDPGINTCFFF